MRGEEAITGRRHQILAAILGSFMVFVGCDSPPSATDVVGSYSGQIVGVSETITLRSDGKFEQRLRMPSGTNLLREGEWKLTHRAIELEGYLHAYGVHIQKELVDPPVETHMTYVWRDGDLVSNWDVGEYRLKPAEKQSGR